MKSVLYLLLFVLCTFLHAERPDHDEYNERTSFLIGRIQRLTDADRVEALKGESDDVIEEFCNKNNYNPQDIKYVLNPKTYHDN